MTSSLMTGDVRQTLDHFRRSVDQLFENFYGLPGESVRSLSQNGQWMFSPVVETAWGDSNLHIRAIVPGIPQQDLKVSVQNNQLILEGERKQPDEFKKNASTQLTYGKFYAAIGLPNNLNVDKLTCRLQDGVLDVQIPFSEQMKPRQIQIQSGEPQPRRSISGQS
jgi:HSP20 family protein